MFRVYNCTLPKLLNLFNGPHGMGSYLGGHSKVGIWKWALWVINLLQKQFAKVYFRGIATGDNFVKGSENNTLNGTSFPLKGILRCSYLESIFVCSKLILLWSTSTGMTNSFHWLVVKNNCMPRLWKGIYYKSSAKMLSMWGRGWGEDYDRTACSTKVKPTAECSWNGSWISRWYLMKRSKTPLSLSIGGAWEGLMRLVS